MKSLQLLVVLLLAVTLPAWAEPAPPNAYPAEAAGEDAATLGRIIRDYEDLVLCVGRTLAWERPQSMRAHPKLTERAYRPATAYSGDLAPQFVLGVP